MKALVRVNTLHVGEDPVAGVVYVEYRLRLSVQQAEVDDNENSNMPVLNDLRTRIEQTVKDWAQTNGVEMVKVAPDPRIIL